MSGRAHAFVLVITLCNVGFILRLVRRRQLRAKYSILWLSLGTGLMALAASPRILDWAARRLGVSYPPAALFICAISLLFLLAVHFSWELSRLEDRLRVLAEELAVRDAVRPDEPAGPRAPSPGG